MSSRRQFLQRCSSVILGSAALPAAGMLESAGRFGGAMTGASTFAKQVNSVFQVRSGTGFTVPLTLAAVEKFRLAGKEYGLSEENFTLHFTAPAGVDLAQDTYAFQHRILGKMDIFIVPAPHDMGGYLATFHCSPVHA